MNKVGSIILFTIGAVLAGVYVYYFTNWLTPVELKMVVMQRPIPMKAQEIPPAQKVAFVFDRRYGLTEVKVVPLLNGKYNEFTLASWHLIAHSNSVPTRGFAYGEYVRGMIPAAPHAKVYPLEPNVAYRVMVASGKHTAEFDFTAKPAPIFGAEPPPAAPAVATPPAPGTAAP